MKTWWNFLPALILAFTLPFIAGALPTAEFKGHFFGGGVVRETAINQVAQWLPRQAGRNYVEAFSNATTTQEYMLYLPIALTSATALVALLFSIYSLYIRLSNWIDREIYQSQRKASKGA